MKYSGSTEFLALITVDTREKGQGRIVAPQDRVITHVLRDLGPYLFSSNVSYIHDRKHAIFLSFKIYDLPRNIYGTLRSYFVF